MCGHARLNHKSGAHLVIRRIVSSRFCADADDLDLSIRSLFGEYCSDDSFEHDRKMERYFGRNKSYHEDADSQATTSHSLVELTENVQRDEAGLGSYHEADLVGESQASQGDVKPGSHHGADVLGESQASTVTEQGREVKLKSWNAIISNAEEHHRWEIIPLVSTRDNHGRADIDLGSR
jgi:hypothetical protein